MVSNTEWIIVTRILYSWTWSIREHEHVFYNFHYSLANAGTFLFLFLEVMVPAILYLILDIAHNFIFLNVSLKLILYFKLWKNFFLQSREILKIILIIKCIYCKEWKLTFLGILFFYYWHMRSQDLRCTSITLLLSIYEL